MDKAVELARTKDRIHLRHTFYRCAKTLEARGQSVTQSRDWLRAAGWVGAAWSPAPICVIGCVTSSVCLCVFRRRDVGSTGAEHVM